MNVTFFFRYSCVLILLLSIYSVNVYSQNRANENYIVKGILIDSANNKHIAYATITAFIGDTAITSTYSNEEGEFRFEVQQQANFIIEVSSVEYNLQRFEVKLKKEERLYDMGELRLSRLSKNLQGVTVVGRKKLIDLRPGMLVYNAEYDLSLKGGTAADVLRKAPVLNVDAQGNVSMRGSRNLKILIDGKFSGQMARNPADALNMIPANTIRSVEVITTPSAKYDAEGAAGVINILTKKGNQRVSGALEFGAGNFEQVFNPRLSINKNKWNISVNGHLHRFRMKDASTSSRIHYKNNNPELILEQEMNQDNTAPHGSGDINIVYRADSTSEISLGTNLRFGNWPDDSRRFTTMRLPNGTIIEQYNQSATSDNKYFGTDFNMGYIKKFRKPGQELTLLAQFSPDKERSPYHLVQFDLNNVKLYEEQNNDRDKNRGYTFQADYIQPISDKGIFSLESGLKLIMRKAIKWYNVFAATGNNPLNPVDDRSDVFTYKQNVWAAYSMLKSNLKKNWYSEVGLRLEQTAINGNIEKAKNYFENSFTNLIPTATVSKKLNDNQTFSLSYTQRLTRPFIWDLNPNIDASDPKNLTSGNPELKPEVAHQVEFTYGFYPSPNFFLNTASFWKQTNNAIIEFTSVDTNGVALTRNENLAANKMFGLNLSALATINSWWSTNGNLNIEYLNYTSDALQIFNEGWGLHGNVNSTFKLPKNFSIQAFGEINTRKIQLQGYETSTYLYSIAVKKEIPAKKISLTLSVTNPFKKYVSQKEVIKTSGFYYVLNNQDYNRALKLTINWEFGGMFNQKESKRISNDDVKGQPRG